MQSGLRTHTRFLRTVILRDYCSWCCSVYHCSVKTSVWRRWLQVNLRWLRVSQTGIWLNALVSDPVQVSLRVLLLNGVPAPPGAARGPLSLFLRGQEVSLVTWSRLERALHSTGSHSRCIIIIIFLVVIIFICSYDFRCLCQWALVDSDGWLNHNECTCWL